MLARVPSAGRLIEAHPAEQTDAAHAPRAAPQRSPNARNARRPAGQRPQPAEEVSQRRARCGLPRFRSNEHLAACRPSVVGGRAAPTAPRRAHAKHARLLFDTGPRAARAQRPSALGAAYSALTHRSRTCTCSPAKSRLSTQNLGWVSPTGRRISVVDWEDPWAPEPGTAWHLEAPVASQNEAKQPTARALMLSDTAGR